MDEVNIAFQYFVSHGHRNRVMFDVGGHSGGAFHKFAKNCWEVFSFEPNPAMRRVIVSNIEKWEFNTVKVFDKALSDTHGEKLTFYTSKESTGISSLIPFHDTHEGKLEVEVTTVKDVIKTEKVKKIDFLKIDVEGNDFKVLKGVDWEEHSPLVIVVEYEDSKTSSLGIKMPEIYNFLVDRGYSVFVSEWEPIVKYGAEHRWKQFLTNETFMNYNPDGWGNLVAFKKIEKDEFLNLVQKSANEDIKKYKELYHNRDKALKKIKTGRLYRFIQKIKKVIS